MFVPGKTYELTEAQVKALGVDTLIQRKLSKFLKMAKKRPKRKLKGN